MTELSDKQSKDQQESRAEDVSDIIAENEALIEEFLKERDVPLVDEVLSDDHRSGYVAVIGKPNVGKSTLMNALLGEKLAIVTPKPQTTRTNQLGVLTTSDYQIVFVDTPGIHEARNQLGEYMVTVAQSAIPDADVILVIADISQEPTAADRAIAGLVNKQRDAAVVLVLNKVDLVDDETAEIRIALYQALTPQAEAIMTSATESHNVEAVLDFLVAHLPSGPRFFPADVLTQTHLRDNAAEIIREHILRLYEQEVPHSVAVKIDQFKPRSDDMTYIAATIYVERDTQKAILIGKGGKALKRLGKVARGELQDLLGTKVYLELWVKVLKNWRKDDDALRRLGFDLPE